MSDAERFADAVVRFVRGFGLHRPERTPCGFDAGVAEAHALGELSAGTLRQGDLAERLCLTKSTVSRLVTNLVDRGWAERWAVDDDGRGVTVGLTKTGRDAATRLRKARTSRMQALLEAVPTERRRDVVDALALLEQASRPATPGMPEPTESSNGGGRWSVVLAIVVALGFVGTVVGVVVKSARDDTPSRQETVAARGATVMPFDLDATTHAFDATETGGVQTVVADDTTDDEQIALIRSHLQEEVKRFRRGDFGDPESIHGRDMPGVRTLAANADSLEITYGELDNGGEVLYASAEPQIVAALHDWFAAQLRDHGAHAQAGEL